MTLSFLREVRHMLNEAYRRGNQRYRVDSVNYNQHAQGLTGFAEAVDTVGHRARQRFVHTGARSAS